MRNSDSFLKLVLSRTGRRAQLGMALIATTFVVGCKSRPSESATSKSSGIGSNSPVQADIEFSGDLPIDSAGKHYTVHYVLQANSKLIEPGAPNTAHLMLTIPNDDIRQLHNGLENYADITLNNDQLDPGDESRNALGVCGIYSFGNPESGKYIFLQVSERMSTLQGPNYGGAMNFSYFNTEQKDVVKVSPPGDFMHIHPLLATVKWLRK